MATRTLNAKRPNPTFILTHTFLKAFLRIKRFEHRATILQGYIIFLAELSGLYYNTMFYFNALHATNFKVKKLNFKSTRIRSIGSLV